MALISMLSDKPMVFRSNKELRNTLVVLAVASIFGTDFSKSMSMASEVLGEDVQTVAFGDLAMEAING